MGRDFALPDSSERWVVDQDFIPRYKSTATIVIEGCRPPDDAAEATPSFVADQYLMWTGLGFPPCAEIVPVWCRRTALTLIRGTARNGHSPMGDKVKARRAEVFPLKKGSGDRYVGVHRLVNREGTGYLQASFRKTLKCMSASEAAGIQDAEVQTGRFAMGRGEFARATMTRFGMRWWGLLFFLVVAGAVAAAVVADLRWLVVALMLAFIVAPMVAAFLYFSFGLREECYANVLPHTVNVSPGGFRIVIDVMPPKDYDSDLVRKKNQSQSRCGVTAWISVQGK